MGGLWWRTPCTRLLCRGLRAIRSHIQACLSATFRGVYSNMCVCMWVCAPWVPHTFGSSSVRMYVGPINLGSAVHCSSSTVDSCQKQPFHTAQRPTKCQTGRRPTNCWPLRRRTTRYVCSVDACPKFHKRSAWSSGGHSGHNGETTAATLTLCTYSGKPFRTKA